MTQAGSDNAPESTRWRERALERTVGGIRARAIDTSDRFITAAMDLLSEVGTDFTVQDVVDRSRTSLRAFYGYFGSKDDLLLAVYEEAMTGGLQHQIDAIDRAGADPLDRIRAFTETLYGETASADPTVMRALALYHWHLAESRPAELQAAAEPQLSLLRSLIVDAQRAGSVRSDIEANELAQLLLQTISVAVQTNAVGTAATDVDTKTIWSFCAFGITAPTES